MNARLLLAVLGFALAVSLTTGCGGNLAPTGNPSLVPQDNASSLPPLINVTRADKPATPPGLEKIVFIHYRKGYGKPPTSPGGKKQTENYKLLGKGLFWKTLPVTYVVDADNPYGLSSTFIASAIQSAAQEWDANTGAALFDGYGIVQEASWDGDTPDGRNELLFDNYPQANVIAVTVIWGVFSGSPSARRITEFDVMFDTDFTWGDATLNSQLMDLQNIATHEIGHGLGLNDLYTASCSEETMYGYSDYGETKKRTLNTGDVAGIHVLYGS